MLTLKLYIYKEQYIFFRCDYNKYTLQYISTLAEIFTKRSKKESTEDLEMKDEDEDPDDDTTGDEYMLSD